MTKADIIKLAREAGCLLWSIKDQEKLERFYNLVAAAEREACAKLCENLPMQQDRDVRDECAAAIRARGTT